MTYQQLKKRTEGFTIIEVLIVLAIAGLILLIVFLAVPALQRNSRNTTLKNDAASIAGAIAEYQSNNNGGLPASIANSSGTVTVGAAGTNQATASINGSTTLNGALTAAPGTGVPAAGSISYRLGARCDGSTNSRAAAVYYPIEASTLGRGCVES